jgi:hypothetical protein
MTTYFRNQPVAADDLDISQPFLVSNTNSADTVFGFEHYAFSNTTDNQGLHNTVTTPPIIGGVAPTTTEDPIFYGFSPSTPVGMLQFSRGPTNAEPTALTALHAPMTGVTLLPGGVTNILDFTGLGGIMVKVFACCVTSTPALGNPQETFVIWNSAAFTSITNYLVSSGLSVISSGNILQLKNVLTVPTLAPVIWTLEFKWI